MRYRITIRGHGIELRGYLDAYDPHTLGRFGTMMEPFGLVIASPAAADYDPFAESEAGGLVWYEATISAEQLEELADEAERGYDPIEIKQVPHPGPGQQLPGGSLGGF